MEGFAWVQQASQLASIIWLYLIVKKLWLNRSLRILAMTTLLGGSLIMKNTSKNGNHCLTRANPRQSRQRISWKRWPSVNS